MSCHRCEEDIIALEGSLSEALSIIQHLKDVIYKLNCRIGELTKNPDSELMICEEGGVKDCMIGDEKFDAIMRDGK